MARPAEFIEVARGELAGINNVGSFDVARFYRPHMLPSRAMARLTRNTQHHRVHMHFDAIRGAR